MFPFTKKKELLDEATRNKVVTAIKEAESKTSGEVRVFVEHSSGKTSAMHRAKDIFARLQMHKTKYRNGVLVYVALTDRQFAIYGDVDIDKKAREADFWNKAAALLLDHLKQNNVAQGLCTCIEEIGKVLAQHYPYDETVPRNQLPDEIVFGK